MPAPPVTSEFPGGAHAVKPDTGAGEPTAVALLNSCVVAYAKYHERMRHDADELHGHLCKPKALDTISNGSLADTVSGMLANCRYFATLPAPDGLRDAVRSDVIRQLASRMPKGGVPSPAVLASEAESRLDEAELALRQSLYLFSLGSRTRPSAQPAKGRCVNFSEDDRQWLREHFLTAWLVPRHRWRRKKKVVEGRKGHQRHRMTTVEDTVADTFAEALKSRGLDKAQEWFDAAGGGRDALNDELRLYDAVCAEEDLRSKLADYHALLAAWIARGQQPDPAGCDHEWNVTWACPFTDRPAAADLLQTVDNLERFLLHELTVDVSLEQAAAARQDVRHFVTGVRSAARRYWDCQAELAAGTDDYSPALARVLDAELVAWARRRSVREVYKDVRDGLWTVDALLASGFGADQGCRDRLRAAPGVASEQVTDAAIASALRTILIRDDARRSLVWALTVGCFVGPEHCRATTRSASSRTRTLPPPDGAALSRVPPAPLGPGASVVLWHRGEGDVSDRPACSVTFGCDGGIGGLVLFGRHHDALEAWYEEVRGRVADELSRAVAELLHPLVAEALEGALLVSALEAHREGDQPWAGARLPRDLRTMVLDYLCAALATWTSALPDDVMYRFQSARRALREYVDGCVGVLNDDDAAPPDAWGHVPDPPGLGLAARGLTLSAEALGTYLRDELASAYMRLPARLFARLGEADCADPLVHVLLGEAAQVLWRHFVTGVDPSMRGDVLGDFRPTRLCGLVDARLTELAREGDLHLVSTGDGHTSTRHALACLRYGKHGELWLWSCPGSSTDVLRADGRELAVDAEGCALHRGDSIYLGRVDSFRLG